MSYLVVAGIVVPVSPSGGSEEEQDVIGSDSRAYAGNLRSTVNAEYRNWEFTTKPLSIADDEALRTACALGAHVVCSGTALGNGATNYTCRLTLGKATHVKVAGGHKRIRTLRLRQVS